MSKKILIKFDCVACTCKSSAGVIKPTPGKPTVQWAECENCDSKHLLRIRKQNGGGHTAFTYGVIDAELTAEGIKQANHIETKKLEKIALDKLNGQSSPQQQNEKG